MDEFKVGDVVYVARVTDDAVEAHECRVVGERWADGGVPRRMLRVVSADGVQGMLYDGPSVHRSPADAMRYCVAEAEDAAARAEATAQRLRARANMVAAAATWCAPVTP